MGSLEESDKAAAAVQVGPRVSLDAIQNNIWQATYFTADTAVENAIGGSLDAGLKKTLGTLTICIMVMRNGFTVVGKSAPASPENFDAALGRKFSYEDCIRQLWPLMGYALRDKLAQH